jgi:glycosyltransferase involved in cell wall biosynthesis
MHVLVLPSWYSTTDLPWSGAFFEDQAVALARAGARVGVAFVERRSLRLLSPAGLGASHFQIACAVDRGVTTLRMKGWNTLGQTVAGARVWCALSERLVNAYVRRFGVPDVLHAHTALWAGRVAVRMGRKLSRPAVVTEHSSLVMRGLLGPDERREAGRVYRDADAVLAVSETLLSAVGATAGAPIGRVVPNAVDFDFFTLPPIPRRRAPFTFLCVSSLVSGKRVDRIIRAFSQVVGARPDARLVVVGDGVEADHLRRLARNSGLATQVEFTGGLPRHGVRQRMWTADTLVLPSASETFGVVLVEALATGMPVVSTRCGGPEGIVEDGLGVLVDRDDEPALAEAMVTMIGRSYPETLLRERAMRRFGFETVAQHLLDVYAGLETRARR